MFSPILKNGEKSDKDSKVSTSVANGGNDEKGELNYDDSV